MNPINEIFETFANSHHFSASIRQTWKLKIKGLSFAVIGYRATGKSTILDVMRGKIAINKHAPTAPGGQSIRDFDATLVSENDYEIYRNKKVRIKNITDMSGEERAWDEWGKQYLENRPKGILFVIDQNDINMHKKALDFFTEILEYKNHWFKTLMRGPSKNQKSFKELKAFWILINKQDEWESLPILQTEEERILWKNKDQMTENARLEFEKRPKINELYFRHHLAEQIERLNTLFNETNVSFRIIPCSALYKDRELKENTLLFYKEMLSR